MQTSRITVAGAVMLSFVLFGLPAFGDEQATGNLEETYSRAIDKEIANCQAKIELKNSNSANLQRDALKARVKSGFLKDYKKELIAAMKRDGIGTKDYQVSYFLNNKFVEVYTSAGGQYRAVGKCC